jgi:hypothetical protein
MQPNRLEGVEAAEGREQAALASISEIKKYIILNHSVWWLVNR